MKKHFKKLAIPLSILYIMLIQGYFQIPQLFTVNISESMPMGLYWLSEPDNLQRGDVIDFEADEDVLALAYERNWLKPGMHFLKFIYAVPGDTYEIKNGRYIVNGEEKGEIQKYDSKSRCMPELPEGEYTVPDGYVLVGTPVVNSFDSRYYGPVPISRIYHKAAYIGFVR